jgi:hypothetical protein
MTKARRPYLYVINALSLKYARLKGQLALAPGSNQVVTDMAHVGAVLRMFDPTLDLDAIPARRPYKPRRESWMGTALSILRRSDRPLQARELARMVMRAKGIPLDDHRRLLSISCGVQNVLGRLKAQGLVYSVGKPRRWAVVR